MPKTPSKNKAPEGSWVFALCVAAAQIGIAVFAVYSSSKDILSDGACIGGVFGSLANMAVLLVVLVWSLVLAVKSRKEARWHGALKPLLVVAISSIIAIVMGMNAGLRCTV